MRRAAAVIVWAACAAAALAACGRADDETGAAPSALARQLMIDVHMLADDAMEGRRAGSLGGARARDYVVARLAVIGVPPAPGGYVRPFTFDDEGTPRAAANVVGVIEGALPAIVISAHYDHEGIKDGAIYNGADDNASGVAALLALAEAFTAEPPRHTIIFAAFDAEEEGEQGAYAFVADPPLPLADIALNINLDMVSQNDRDELYVAGVSHAPWLAPWTEWIADEAAVTLLQGHDTPEAGPSQDWTTESDHVAFHEAGIPFLYFGVEDHPRYHTPEDDADAIPVDFFTRSVETILLAARRLDAELDAIQERRAE